MARDQIEIIVRVDAEETLAELDSALAETRRYTALIGLDDNPGPLPRRLRPSTHHLELKGEWL